MNSVHCSRAAPFVDVQYLVHQSSRLVEDNRWCNSQSRRVTLTRVVSQCLEDMSDVVDLLDTPPKLFVLHSCIFGFFSFVSVSHFCVHVSFTFLIAVFPYCCAWALTGILARRNSLPLLFLYVPPLPLCLLPLPSLPPSSLCHALSTLSFLIRPLNLARGSGAAL